MADGAAADEGLGHLVHFDRRLHPGVNALLFQGILQGQRIDHRGQHAHVVGGDAVHFLGLLGHAAKEISAADDDGNLDAQGVNVRQFSGDFVDAQGIDAETLVRGQGLAGELEQDALEYRSRHQLDFRVSGFQFASSGLMPISTARAHRKLETA